MTDLPASWFEAPIAEIAESCLGKMLDKAKNRGRPMPYLRNINVRWGAFDLSDLSTMPFEDNERERYGLKAGDLVVCEGGEPGRCAVWHGQMTDMRIQKALHRVRPGSTVLPEWIALRLRHLAESGTLSEYFTGTGISHLTGASLSRVQVPLPPMPEQRRIVAKLDALQYRSRLAREALAAIPTLLDHYRQSVLAAAFRGDLSKDWRTSKLAGVDPMQDREGLPSIPTSWTWIRLPDLGALGRGKSRHRPRNDEALYGGHYPFIQTGDVARSQGRVRSHSQTYTELGLQQSRLWPAGTVVITIAANIADSAILTYDACFPDSVVGFIPDPSRGRSDYVEYFIRTAKRDLAAFAPATAQKNINLEILQEVLLPCAPLDEQAVIVAKIGQAEAFIASVKSAVNGRLLDHLDQSLLATAFRGELVPQDPADEPASVLLDRIRSARAQAGAAPRTRRKNSTGMDGIHGMKPSAAPSHAFHPSQLKSDPYATLLSALRTKGSLASSDAQAVTDLGPVEVRPLLQRLVAEGHARVEGQKRGTRYVAT